MARDRFGFLEHHGFVKSSSGQHAQGGGYRFFWRDPFLSRFDPCLGLVTLRQKFVRRCQNCLAMRCSHRAASARLSVVGRIAAILPNTHARLMASQDTVLSVPAGSNCGYTTVHASQANRSCQPSRRRRKYVPDRWGYRLAVRPTCDIPSILFRFSIRACTRTHGLA
jgi:hypothetical protein